MLQVQKEMILPEQMLQRRYSK